MSGNSVPNILPAHRGKWGPWNPRTEWQLHEGTRLNPIAHERGALARVFDRIHTTSWVRSTPMLFVSNMALITAIAFYGPQILMKLRDRGDGSWSNGVTVKDTASASPSGERPIKMAWKAYSTFDLIGGGAQYVDRTSVNVPTEAIREGYTYTTHIPEQVSWYIPVIGLQFSPERFVKWYKDGEETTAPSKAESYVGYPWNPIRNHLYGNKQ